MAEKKYYLAYGSNLNLSQMTFRCPTAYPVATAMIPDYELLFKGSKTGSYLTIEKKKGSCVPVAVWKVTPADEKRLDIYEGYPQFYYKKPMRISATMIGSKRKRELDAFVYIMHEERKFGIPTHAYLEGCVDGYRAFGFDPEILSAAVLRSKEMIEKADVRWCPKCGNEYAEHPAISRDDNSTLICPECGIAEALEAFYRYQG